MAKVLRVTRLAANPRRVKRKKRNAKRHTKRRMSPKQIKIFGTKNQKAALKRSQSAKRAARTRAKNPRKVKRYSKRRARRSTNPAPVILTLGAMNPRKTKRRKNTVAATKKHKKRRAKATTKRRRRVASNPKRHYTRRRRTAKRHNKRRNPTRVVYVKKRTNRRRRKNPNLFGHSITSKDTLKLVGGGLLGVAAAKFIPTVLPTSSLGSLATSSIGRTVITGVSAVAAGWLVAKFDAELGSGVLFGGLMQTASVAMNAFLPSFTVGGVPIALSGMGDLLPGQYAVPQNPIRAAIPPPAPPVPPPGARITMNGLSRAYGVAYGR